MATPPDEGQGRPPHPEQPDGGFGVFHTALQAKRILTIVLAPDVPAGPDGEERAGITDMESGAIILSEQLSPGELNATVVHELAHLAYPEASEDEVEHIAACSLIPTSAAQAVIDGASPREIAAQLLVDAKLVASRVRGLLAD